MMTAPRVGRLLHWPPSGQKELTWRPDLPNQARTPHQSTDPHSASGSPPHWHLRLPVSGARGEGGTPTLL